jgi:hypothetical protein
MKKIIKKAKAGTKMKPSPKKPSSPAPGKSKVTPVDDYKNMKDSSGKTGTMGGEGTRPPFTPEERKKMPRIGNMGSAKNGKAVKKKSFPDLNKDGKVTKADILKGRGVIAKKGKTIKKK